LNENTRLAEFLLTPAETTRLFKQLGEQFDVTVPEEKIPDLETFAQITNALYKAQFGK
jgi:acyl carrier protein